MLTTAKCRQKDQTYSPNSTGKLVPNAVKNLSFLKLDAGAANHAVTAIAMRGGEKSMYDTCIIILVLSEIALVANVAVCLYTLHLAKQAEHRQYMEGFTNAFIQYECETHGITLSDSQISPADEEQQR